MLVLLPAYLSENSPKDQFAPVIQTYIQQIDHYFVENEKTARKVIKFFCPEKKQSDLKLFVLDKYTEIHELKEATALLEKGVDMGLLSEAGLPCIADPGNLMVRWAHEHSIKVVPVNGPSSIILSLISSGFNGQNFTFHGYLPIDKSERRKALLQLESLVRKTKATQIFMETPYRNDALLKDILTYLAPEQKLCIASNIGDMDSEFILTLKVKEWKKKLPELHKIPTVFLLGE